MEDQLICGALQTLNEEACEDVLEETDDVKPNALTLPESEPGERIEMLFNDYTCISIEPAEDGANNSPDEDSDDLASYSP